MNGEARSCWTGGQVKYVMGRLQCRILMCVYITLWECGVCDMCLQWEKGVCGFVSLCM